MFQNQGLEARVNIPCTMQSSQSCSDCSLQGDLMCRFDRRDMLHFFLLILPFAVTSIAGAVRADMGRYLWLWLGYALFFFFVWEAYILCRHCPYWAGRDRMLRCHANYGVFKIWRYTPRPMSRWEQAQFIIGALILVLYPFSFLLVGREFLLAFIALCTLLNGIYELKTTICTRCVNFSCPLNAVPPRILQAYLSRNPEIMAAWKTDGRA